MLMDDSATITISNFGPIKDAEINLSRLSILLGNNNVGKTYSAMIIHSIANLIDDLIHRLTLGYFVKDYPDFLFEDDFNIDFSEKSRYRFYNSRIINKWLGKNGAYDEIIETINALKDNEIVDISKISKKIIGYIISLLKNIIKETLSERIE